MISTPFCKINGFSHRNVGAPTPTPSALASIDGPRQDNPVGITTSLLYLKTTTILMDQISGNEIDFILFYDPPGIISARSGGKTNPQSLFLVLS